MRYLITGGAGFIGSHLTESLLKDGEEVTVIDNFSTGCRANLASFAGFPGLKIIEGDVVTQPELVRGEISACDAVVHLAAAVGVNLVVEKPVWTLTTNVRGTENVLMPAAELGKRIITASTSEVYGKSFHEYFREDDDLLIGSPRHSRWGYACSKLLDEFYVMAYCRENALPGTVVRFFNTVGPRQSGRYGMVVPRFVRWAIANEQLQIYGDGEQSRCFCHVRDVVRALKMLLHNEKSYGEIYNIGSSRLVSITELAKLVIRETGSRSELRYIPYEQAYATGFEDMRRRMPDTAKLRELTGWRPELSLEQIIADVKASLC